MDEVSSRASWLSRSPSESSVFDSFVVLSVSFRPKAIFREPSAFAGAQVCEHSIPPLPSVFLTAPNRSVAEASNRMHRTDERKTRKLVPTNVPNLVE